MAIIIVVIATNINFHLPIKDNVNLNAGYLIHS